MPARRNVRVAQPVTQQLSEQDIVDAALRLIRKIGADKLSMRTLAAQLGVTPMAIYYHVPSKEALLELVIDAVLANVPMPTPNPQRWQAQMKAYAVTGWHLINAYPDLNRILVSRPNTKSGRALSRYGISILLAAGFGEREAALAITTYHTYMFGAHAAVSAQSQLGKRAQPRAASKQKVSAGAEAIGAVARELRSLRVEDALDYGMDAVLSGIAARAQSKRGARARG